MSGQQLLRDFAPIQVTLPEGLRVMLRPLQKTDRERVRRAYNLLSEESRMNRFWEKPKEMSQSRAESLTDTDNRNHVAWLVLDPDDLSFPGFAGASYWRDPDNAANAEIAFTVGDAWQGRGLATLLFSILWHDAWKVGIRKFHAVCRLENTSMTEWWRGVGGSVESAIRHHELTLVLESPETFLNRVAFEMPPSPKRVEVVEWMGKWLETTLI